MEDEAPWWRWLAVFPPLAVFMLMAGGGLTPHGVDQPITSVGTLTELRIASTQANRLFAASTLIIYGLGAMAVAFVAIATLCRDRRGSGLAMVAAAIGVFGCFTGAVANVLVGTDLAGAAKAAATRDAAAHVLVSTNTGPVPVGLLVAYLAGIAVGSILMGIALWRSRSVPRWLAVAFPIFFIIAGAAPPGPANVLLSVPLAVVMVLLAVEIWSAASNSPATGEDPALLGAVW